MASDNKPSVIVVEDDVSVRRSLRRLILSEGFGALTFDRPHSILESELPATNACLIIDVHLPEMTGVELAFVLAAAGCRLPVILITAHKDLATSEMTSSANAFAVLFKPFTRKVLLDAIAGALAVNHQE